MVQPDFSANPNMPRTIRARTGNTSDPVPEGKHIAEPESHFNIEPAKHDGDNKGQELSLEDVKAHKEELQHMQAQEGKYTAAATNGPPEGGKNQSVGNKIMNSNRSRHGV